MTTETRADDQIQRDVMEELRWDPRVNPSEIGIAVKGAVVTLGGWVDSLYKKWAAEQAAHRVRGVVAVANAIEVRLPGSAERTDGEIASASVQVLESDAVLDVEGLDVNVSKGWVTLGGEVEWSFQKDDAERLVRRLWGVVGVTNMIAVRARPTPLELKHRIEEALVRSAETDARRIEVELKDGKVVLKGTVRSWAEREEAERTAWLAPGITHVVNQIELAY